MRSRDTMARLKANIFPELDEHAVQKLRSRNILTVYDFMQLPCNDLMNRADLSFKDVESLRTRILKNFGGTSDDSSVSLYQRELCDVIPTGIESLDALLEGGLLCGEIYELCGYSSAGKSQLCHWISVQATLHASTEVHYMDTTSNFCVSRILMILESRECSDADVAKVMSNIKVYRITSVSDAFTVLHRLAGAPNKDRVEKCKKLVVLDSLTALFATTSLNDLNPMLSNLSSVCRYFASHCRGSVVTVNTVREAGRTLVDSDRDAVMSKKPALPNYWLSVPNVRLLIGHWENSRRKIEIWKSCRLENGKGCVVVIKDEGFFSA